MFVRRNKNIFVVIRCVIWTFIFVTLLFLGISYKQLTQQILPLASHYSMTARFVEEKVLPEDGQVNHALRGAIKSLLKDYLVCIII